MAEEGFGAELKHAYGADHWRLVTRVYYQRLEADTPNPIYGKRCEMDTLGGSITGFYPRPFGWDRWTANATVAVNDGDSNINFYDTGLWLVSAGMARLEGNRITLPGKDGRPALMRLPEINFIDDKTGKPVGINMYIGKRPVAAFGNSDGDRQMLEWTAAGEGARLTGLVYHDDEKREYAYGPAGGLPNSPFGTFSQATMDEAKKAGWLVISMKNDWARIFAFDE
jgi:hypothetical protein